LHKPIAQRRRGLAPIGDSTKALPDCYPVIHRSYCRFVDANRPILNRSPYLPFMTSSTSLWHKSIFWGIRLWELLAVLAGYVCLWLLYVAAIWLSSGQEQWAGISLNYTLKLLLTAPFWWFFFRKVPHWPFQRKALLHLPACALYVGVWLGLFQKTADYLEIGRLMGAGIWWDVYIPTLVYLMQFSVFHAYAYWNEIQHRQEKEKELTRLAHAAELNTLKAQIQPHFLFNTLNSISASLPAAQEPTRRQIAQLADVFRFAMSVSEKSFVPLRQEVEFLCNFLALEQQRFGDRLSVEVRLDEQLHDFPLPPMLLQPLVENALKHGISGSVEGGTVRVCIEKKGDKVHFEVSDTGKGINGDTPEILSHKGIGLENTRRRLKRLYDADLHLLTNEPRGLRVIFELPESTQNQTDAA